MVADAARRMGRRRWLLLAERDYAIPQGPSGSASGSRSVTRESRGRGLAEITGAGSVVRADIGENPNEARRTT
jgi:hypothetical protein